MTIHLLPPSQLLAYRVFRPSKITFVFSFFADLMLAPVECMAVFTNIIFDRTNAFEIPCNHSAVGVMGAVVLELPFRLILDLDSRF